MASTLFRPADDLMVQYARYHRDPRNITTHFVGIPMIVFAILTLLARTSFELAGRAVTPAFLLWALSGLWYLSRGDLVLGVAVTLANGVLLMLALPAAAGSTGGWLACGLGAFVLGWVIQFIGHYYEGRKPAFVDDLVGLLVGPMFVAGEALFSLGLCRRLASEIERQAGPTRLRDLASPVA